MRSQSLTMLLSSACVMNVSFSPFLDFPVWPGVLITCFGLYSLCVRLTSVLGLGDHPVFQV